MTGKLSDPAEKRKTEWLLFSLMGLFVFGLPYDRFYSSLALITLIAVAVFNFSTGVFKRIPPAFWVFQIPWLLAAAGYYYSSDRGLAGSLMERQSAILMMPLLIPLALEATRQRSEALLKILMVSAIVVVTYLLCNTIYLYIVLHLKSAGSIFSGVFFNHSFSKPLGIHAGYLSMYIALSIFYSVYRFTRETQVNKKIVFLGITIFLLAGIFFLASRNTIIATFFILLFVLPFYQREKKILYFGASLVIVVLVTLAITNIDYLRSRFSVEMISEIKALENGASVNYNTLEPRVERWKGAMELIRHSPVTGYGTGDEIKMLRTQYIKRGLFISYTENFNAHNQYLSYLIKNGIIGFVIFVAAFGYFVFLALRARDFVYLAFLILLLFGFYTENILDANKGIFFFAFFNTFLGYVCLRERKNPLQEGDAVRNV